MKNLVGFTGGHPLRLDNLLYIQAGAKEALIALAKTHVPAGITTAVLTGCVLSESGGSTSISAGWILHNGDIYRVPAKTVSVTGGSNLKLVLVTDTASGYPTTVAYKDSGPKNIYQETIADFLDTGDPGTPILTFDQYLYRVAGKVKRTVEMYAPADALSNHFDTSSGLGKNDCLGYALCDGQNGTPDLRGRFVVGYSGSGDYNNVGNTGGAASVTLTGAQSGLAAHTHSVVQSGDQTQGYGVQPVGGGATGAGTLGSFPSNTNVVNRFALVTDSSGSSNAAESHENRPPYYTLVFMMKL